MPDSTLCMQVEKGRAKDQQLMKHMRRNHHQLQLQIWEALQSGKSLEQLKEQFQHLSIAQKADPDTLFFPAPSS